MRNVISVFYLILAYNVKEEQQYAATTQVVLFLAVIHQVDLCPACMQLTAA